MSTRALGGRGCHESYQVDIEDLVDTRQFEQSATRFAEGLKSTAVFLQFIVFVSESESDSSVLQILNSELRIVEVTSDDPSRFGEKSVQDLFGSFAGLIVSLQAGDDQAVLSGVGGGITVERVEDTFLAGVAAFELKQGASASLAVGRNLFLYLGEYVEFHKLTMGLIAETRVGKSRKNVNRLLILVSFHECVRDGRFGHIAVLGVEDNNVEFSSGFASELFGGHIP